MPGKNIQPMTTDRLRKEIWQPLYDLTHKLSEEMKRLERLDASGKCKYPFVEANIKGATDALKLLDRFMREEVTSKLRDIEEGIYRWRDAEKKAREGKET